MRGANRHPMIARAQQRDGATGERGAALIIALVIMTVMAVVVAAVVTYATSSVMSVKSFRQQRDQRYGGDAAVKAAIDYAQFSDTTARDPKNNLSNAPCVVHTTAVVDGVNTPIKGSCLADAGGQSGQPADVGLTPPEALTLLSNRSAEPGPYNPPNCTGWWDSFVGLFTLNNVGTDANRGMLPESGAYFWPRQGKQTLNATCGTVSRSYQTFKVRGDVAAASRINVPNGSITSIGGTIRAAEPCNPNVCQQILGRFGKTGVESYLNGTRQDTDPGRKAPSSPAVNSPGDVAAPWVSTGFDANGNARINLPVQTTAYLYDPVTSTANTPTSTCPTTSATIVFKEGWYQDAEVLNRYMRSDGNCKNVTFWFAPNPGPDGKLLTSDDTTASFYFDFRNTSGNPTGCGSGNNGTSKSRWCIGGSSDFNARVTVGTPLGWSPQGVYNPSGTAGDTRPRTAVSVNTANTVDNDLSQSWANADNAKTINNSAAMYTPTGCISFFGFTRCFAQDRAIRVRDFAPKVTGPPLDLPGAPRGRIYLKVAYGVKGWQYADPAAAQIQAVSSSSGQKDCGTYTLFGNTEGGSSDKSQAAYTGSGQLPTYTFTDAQAKRLADTCGTVDLINGFEVKISVTGNNYNNANGGFFGGSSTDSGTTYWWLDGVNINYDSFPSANFPNPTGSGSSSADVAAKSDCDPSKAGGQLIFGGESHVFVADGSMEVCAGPYPVGNGDSQDNHQSIGVYALPSIAEVGPTGGVSSGGAETKGISNTGAIRAIDKNSVNINYGKSCFCIQSVQGIAAVDMNGYTPPAGYRIQKITTRVGYNPKNNCPFGNLGNCFTGAAPTLQTPGGPNCNANQDYPKHTDAAMQRSDLGDPVVLYDASSGRNCLNVSGNGGSLPAGRVYWHAKASTCIFSCNYNDSLDGIEYQVTLAPTGSNPMLLPATGCTVVHPNYNDGSESPDCALIRADTSEWNDNFQLPWSNPEGQWRGRFSVKGTIYAPSSAVEVDDTDYAYPLATRGAVLRTLRVTGFAPRANYNGVAVDNTVDRTPKAREATFTSCIQNRDPNKASAYNDPCKPPSAPGVDDGDYILTRARVRFDIDTSGKARVPTIVWWSQDR